MATGGAVVRRLEFTVEFRILGTLDVIDGERSVGFFRAKPRALLAMLIIHANQVVSADRLVDALWGELPPPSAINTLQGYISQLRQALGAVGGPDNECRIRTQAPGYVLTIDSERIDARRFERLIDEGRRALAASDPQSAVSLFHEALALWRGPALADFVGESFASLEAARLEELRLAAIEAQAEGQLALGHHAELTGRLGTLVAEYPLRERLWAQLMLALYRCGRQAEALRAFQSARHVLVEELGIGPGPELRKVEADILAQAPSLAWEPYGSSTPGTSRRPGTQDTAGSHPSRAPFPRLLSAESGVGYVGRDGLLACLTEALDHAVGGTFRSMLLAGEPGVGKTRTVGEVASAAFARGAVVLYGHCDEDVAVPYQPFVEALDWYTTHVAEPVLGRYPAELTRLQPLLSSRVPNVGHPVSSDPRSEEHLLFEATSSWLIELARRQPVVLVLDDLHWASKPVLLLLRHLLRAATAGVTGVPMLVLGTYRDTELGPDHPLAELLADIHRMVMVDRVAMVGLFPGEVEELVARVAGRSRDENTSRLARTLHADTDGNPFFLYELLRHLIETGAIGGERHPRMRAAAMSLDVPHSVREVVSGRIRRLSVPAQRLLPVAAVVGIDFDVELLAALSDLPEDDLLDGLDQCRRARVIQETDADHYRFAHALVRATLVEEMSATRRRRLHRRIAEAIEKLRREDVVSLAHHFTQAGPDGRDRSRAVRYSLAAAEQALAARALADAESRFSGVLTLLAESNPPDAPERVRAMCGLGEAQRDQGKPEFRTTLLEAARLAQECQDASLMVRAVLANSRGLPSVIGGIDSERLAVTESALAAVGPEPSAERALLLAQQAAEITFTRDDRRRLALADEAEAMARVVGDAGLLARVLNRTGYAAFSAARIDRLVARGEEATRLSDASGDPAQRVLARYFWSAALLTAGDMAAFRAVTKEMLVVAEEAAPTLQWVALASQVRVSQLDGDMETARRSNDEAFQIAQEIGERDGAAWWTATDTMLAWCQGRFSGPVTVALRMGMDLYPTEPAWTIGYAMCMAMEGRADELREVLQADPPDPEELVDHVFPFLNGAMCGVIAFHGGDTELAASTANALKHHRCRWIHHYVGSMGPVSTVLALCAAARGDFDEAVALCVETEAALANSGCSGPLARFRCYYAEILMRRGSPDDAARARDLLHKARRGADDLDAPQLAALVDELEAALDERRAVFPG